MGSSAQTGIRNLGRIKDGYSRMPTRITGGKEENMDTVQMGV